MDGVYYSYSYRGDLVCVCVCGGGVLGVIGVVMGCEAVWESSAQLHTVHTLPPHSTH